MNFVKENNKNGLKIPAAVLELAWMDGEDWLKLSVSSGAVIVTKRTMTAMDMLGAIETLTGVLDEFMSTLYELCGESDECEACTTDVRERDYIHIPADFLMDAGIPVHAKLCGSIDPDKGVICVRQADVKHDLSDVSPALLDYLRCHDICLGGLEELLMSGEVIYGDD